MKTNLPYRKRAKLRQIKFGIADQGAGDASGLPFSTLDPEDARVIMSETV